MYIYYHILVELKDKLYKIIYKVKYKRYLIHNNIKICFNKNRCNKALFNNNNHNYKMNLYSYNGMIFHQMRIKIKIF